MYMLRLAHAHALYITILVHGLVARIDSRDHPGVVVLQHELPGISQWVLPAVGDDLLTRHAIVIKATTHTKNLNATNKYSPPSSGWATKTQKQRVDL